MRVLVKIAILIAISLCLFHHVQSQAKGKGVSIGPSGECLFYGDDSTSTKL